MLSFLKGVAAHISASGRDLSRTTIVFPNRRSALFFRKCLLSITSATSFMPHMVSISYFTQQFCDSVLADDTQLVMILYKVYCRILRDRGREEQIPDFDSFCFWGRILLNDFNDIDAYLCDPKELFHNIKSVREISANYLTDEQKEVISLLWGKHSVPHDTKDFWNHIHISDNTDTPSAHFINLWEILGELYEGFNKALTDGRYKLAYSGMQSRKAYRRIKDMSLEDFRGHRYIFIGFNVLSVSRILIMKRLRDLGIADFYFDNAPVLLKGTKAGDMIGRLVEAFPMPDDFQPEPGPETHDIEIISCPSAVAQAKAMGIQLEKMKESWTLPGGMIDNDRLLGTAVVFAKESMLMPALYSTPAEIPKINITMGLPFNATPFASLMSALISMHLRSYQVRGVTHYFYKDVTDLLIHPYINLFAGKEASLVSKEIFAKRLYNVDANWLSDKFPALGFLFTPLADTEDISSIRAYITNLIDKFSEALTQQVGDNGNKYYELTILDGYSEAVNDICRYAEKYDIKMHERTFLQMIERTVALRRINFAGEPLEGLQFMGFMDTRCLDFDNVILMSMNEKVFPSHNYNPSLIPAALRSAYMLPTQEFEEASYAYQFFRLVSRAKKVRLLFDSRANGAASEMSRYLSQLIYLHPELGIKIRNLTLKNASKGIEPIVVHKTPEVLDELRQFYNGGRKRLSASALKTYMLCPLRFYLEYVRGIRVNDSPMDYIDAASYGSALHQVARQLYSPYLNKTVTSQIIDEMLTSEKLHGTIETLASQALDNLYYGNRYIPKHQPLPGEGQVTAKIITKYITEMLKREKEYPPFVFLGGEVGEHKTFVWNINEKYQLNFTMSIDRIDRISGSSGDDEYLRFIDYKTGSDSLKASGLDSIFSKHDNGGIFQLLLYSHAFARNGYKGKIQPVIYKFVKVVTEGLPNLTFKGADLLDYRDVDSNGDTFYGRFEELIDKIFEKEDMHPFTQTEKSKDCLYCPFSSLCNRFPEKYH